MFARAERADNCGLSQNVFRAEFAAPFVPSRVATLPGPVLYNFLQP